MKKFVLLAGVALLAACGTKEPAPEATATDATATEAATPAVAATGATTANGAGPGSYDVTHPDGTTGVDTLQADGTYVSRDASDKVVEKGTWASKDGKTCFIPEGKTEECYTEGARAADGSFDATGPDGKVTKVKPHVG
jgi:hypothetical protein